MSDATEQALMQAYELIESDRLAEAEALLKPILEQDANNVDAWWLYAHAVSDPETARMALNQVLKLDGSYEGAQDLLIQLDEVYEGEAVLEPPPSRAFARPPSTLPDLPEDDDIEGPDFLTESEDRGRRISGLDEEFRLDDMAEPEPSEMSSSRRRFPLPLLLLILLVIVIVAAIALLNPFGSGAPASTQVAPTLQAALSTPSAEMAQITEEAAATDAVSPDESAIAEALSSFDVADDSMVTMDTRLGNTLLIGICTSAGEAMRTTLDGAMNALASVGSTLETDVDALGVRLMDCESGSTLRVIAVPVADAAAFSAGDLSEAEFQARWIAAA